MELNRCCPTCTLLVLLLGGYSNAQTTTPVSKETCDMQQMFWIAEAANPSLALGHRVLFERAKRMSDCASAANAAKDETRAYDYESTAYLYQALFSGRMVNFLMVRHPEIGKKFDAEDAAGRR